MCILDHTSDPPLGYYSYRLAGIPTTGFRNSLYLAAKCLCFSSEADIYQPAVSTSHLFYMVHAESVLYI